MSHTIRRGRWVANFNSDLSGVVRFSLHGDTPATGDILNADIPGHLVLSVVAELIRCQRTKRHYCVREMAHGESR